MDRRGAFIVLEGPDGAGKTTQARRLVERLEERGLDAVLVREPGGTAVGEAVRAVLLDPANEPMDARTELLLYMASRAQLCREVIRPALERGAVVVADRFLASSAVYQGIAGGVGLEAVREVGAVATGGLAPDLTLLLDLDPARALERVARGRSLDRMERKSIAYHRAVCEGYRAYAAGAPEQVERIDAGRPEAEVAEEVERAVDALLAARGLGRGAERSRLGARP
jgi:dTMP kinase